MDAFLCPKGHQSSEPDYCSECGAKLAENVPPKEAVRAAQDELCPKCGTAREDLGIPFCEACGYNFITATGGAERTIPAVPPPSAQAAGVAAQTGSPARWELTIAVDPTLREPGSPEPPAGFLPFTYFVDAPASLIGRTSKVRAIEPEIALTYDDAVSHRHAILEIDATGALHLRDIGSANGTRLNGKDVGAMVDTPLQDGDAITLGHWSRITVKAVRAGDAA